MLTLEKYSIGVGDRFARQAKAQLHACMLAAERGVHVTPVWNKSFREHGIVGSSPESVREAADRAIQALGWTRPYRVDADHINLGNVDAFLEASDFFTIDVASAIGQPAEEEEVGRFLARHPELITLLSRSVVMSAAARCLAAIDEAAQIYRYIEARKGPGSFITEVSMDETATAQTPPELMVILAAIADQGIPIQTVAPKFSGRFNKGVDFAGDPELFEKEFQADVAVIAEAVSRYSLPSELKLSVHSGSDKFSIYPAIRRTLQQTGAGIHLKTAGTTWLEEIIGLAEAGGDGLRLAKQIYERAFADREALCAPYATVIDIDPGRLPLPSDVRAWSAEQFASALRHDLRCAAYNPHFRQLLHVGFKVAAKLGEQYLDMLTACEAIVARNVTGNILDRHILPVFPLSDEVSAGWH